MRLAVTDMPDHFPAQIANGQAMSVFPRVMNLAFDTADDTRPHVTIDARDNAPLSPGTARLKVPAGLDFSRLVRPGTPVAMRAGILRLRGTELAFDFRAAAPIFWAPARARPNPGTATMAAGWADTWSRFLDAPASAGFAAALSPDNERGAFSRALARRVQASVPDLMRAGARNDLPVALAGLCRLLGSGPGLTPSGDDFATGFFLGFAQTACGRDEERFLHALTRAALARSSDTTDVSRACLAQAAAGRFSAPLTCLVDAILTRADDLATRLSDALAMGHSSGSDATFGLLCGLAAHEPALRARVIDKLNEAHMHEKVTR